MKTEFMLGFHGAYETAIVGDETRDGRIGSALYAYLNIDFISTLHKIKLHCETPLKTANQLSLLKNNWKTIHPFCAASLNILNPESPDLFNQMYGLLSAMYDFQRKLYRIIDDIFLEQPELPTVQKLCILCCSNSEEAKMFASLKNTVRVHRRFYLGGTEVLPELVNEGMLSEKCDLDSRVFFVTDSLQAVLLTEIQQMAEQNTILRKCANCGGLFLPYNGKSIYCDRIIHGTNKSCKDLAAKEKYEKKVAEDEGLKLYHHRTKAYSMRVNRDGSDQIREEYLAWKKVAEKAVSQYSAGEITLEQLNQKTNLPEIKEDE